MGEEYVLLNLIIMLNFDVLFNVSVLLTLVSQELIVLCLVINNYSCIFSKYIFMLNCSLQLNNTITKYDKWIIARCCMEIYTLLIKLHFEFLLLTDYSACK